MKTNTSQRSLRARYGHLGYTLFFLLYLLAYVLVELLITGEDAYWATQIPALDSLVPFCEWFVIPYVLWYPVMATVALYLLLRDPDGYAQYAGCLGTVLLGTILICLLIPNGQDLRLTAFPRDNLLTQLVGSLYAADTNTNVLPSMHVAGSMVIGFAVFHCDSLRSWWVRGTTLVLLTLIILSTVFIKQHAVLDLLVAIPYSLPFYWIWYRWFPTIRKRRCEGSCS